MTDREKQIIVTIEQMGRMYRILHRLSQEELPKSPQWFAVMAEAPVDYIRELNEEVNAYITELTKPLAEQAEAWEAQQRESGGQEEQDREEVTA